MNNLLAVRFINTALGVSLGFLVIRFSSYAAPPFVSSLVFCAFGCLTLPSRLLGGVLSSVFGPRFAIVVGMFSSGLLQLIIASPVPFPIFVLAILFLGLVYEIVEPATQSLAAANESHSREAYGWLWVTLSSAGVLSGLVVAIVMPFGVKFLLYLDGVSSIGCAYLAWSLLPGLTSKRGAARMPLVRLLHDTQIGFWTLLSTLYASEIMIIILMLPKALSMSKYPSYFAGILLAVAALSAFVCNWKRVYLSSQKQTIVLAHCCFAAAMILWAFDNMVLYVLGASLEGGAAVVLSACYQKVAADMAPKENNSVIMSIFGLCWGFGSLIVPLFAFPLIRLNVATLWLTTALLSGLSALLLSILWRFIVYSKESAVVG